MNTVRCTFCPGEQWWPTEGLVDHLERTHGEELRHAARWPDGGLVIFNEDEIDELTT